MKETLTNQQTFNIQAELDVIQSALEHDIDTTLQNDLNQLIVDVNTTHNERIQTVEVNEIPQLQEQFAQLQVQSSLQSLEHTVEKIGSSQELLARYKLTEVVRLLEARTESLREIDIIRKELEGIQTPTKEKHFKYLLDNHPKQYGVLMNTQRSKVVEKVVSTVQQASTYYKGTVVGSFFDSIKKYAT